MSQAPPSRAVGAGATIACASLRRGPRQSPNGHGCPIYGAAPAPRRKRAEVCALSASSAPPPPAQPQPARRRLLRRLFRVAGERTDADEIAIADVVAKLGDRSFGWLLLFFSVLSLLPIPGGGMITALPLFWVLGQMALGYPQIVLPDFVTRQRVNRRTWQRLVLRMAPVIRPIERMLEPRLERIFTGRNERLLGAVQCGTAFALFLPVPLSGFIPASALVITGLGMVERDGKVVLLGAALGIVSILVTAASILLIFRGVQFVAG